ncbi:glycosyltransferase family 2 protein [Gymnodinialimonas sp.]
MDGDPPHVTRPEWAPTTEPLEPGAPSARPHVVDAPSKPPRNEAKELSRLLLMRGLVTAPQMRDAEKALRGTPLSLGQVLTTRGAVSEAELLSALAQIYSVGIADLSSDRPDVSLAPLLPARAAITAEAVIWKRAGSALVIATARPDRCQALRALLPDGQRIVTVLASRNQITEAHRRLYGADLAREAEGRAPERHSCRSWRGGALGRCIIAVAVIALFTALLAPIVLAKALFGIAIVVFTANCILKFAAFAQSLRGAAEPPPDPRAEAHILHKPTVSIIVPLFREPEVAGALVDRLRRIDYPRERLDLILAVEEADPLTLEALQAGSLPPWMRAVIVPTGSPQTKPRALNYVLNYARGDIVGIYDAEDRPEPDQIHRVVQRFSEVPPDVACLQGRLDYYNARHNWLSRMFTVEYAAWFRVLLPGVQRMGLVVPLGGTTLFLRRNVLEAVGAWDAHNVTEDAELGLRLARAGYQTEIVETTTFEEANAAALPWIKQRSRWLKGYLMTWGAAMRRPRVLLNELGAWRFFWLQIQFGGAVLGFLTAPLLWSFMLKPFGVWHPLDTVMSPFAYGLLAMVMLTGLFGSIAISLYACRAKHLRHLRPISPLVEPYYLFGTIAAWIGLFELMAKPFFWAKTAHGRYGAAQIERED